MTTPPPPLATTLRHRKKAVRFGPGATCTSCGSRDLLSLQATDPVLCAECRLTLAGKPTTERHHPAGRHNDAFTAPLPANPHAVLSDAQVDWPTETLRNPDHDFLRTLAAWLRFFADTFAHLSQQALLWATTLERYATHLAAVLGPTWWTTMTDEAR